MILLHVTPYFAPAWAFGGVCRAVTELARAQVASGHTVIVITTDARTRTTRLPSGDDLVDGVRVIRMRNRSMIARARLNLSTPAGFRSIVRHALTTHAVSLVHCHELRTVENLQLAALAGGTFPPLVLSPHGTLPHSTGRGHAKRLWDRLVGGRVLPRFDRVVALTEAEATDVCALWAAHGVPIARDRVDVVPNGVDADLSTHLPSRASARVRWGLGDGPVVVFLGRLAARKGIPLLVSAFAGLAHERPAARLLIAGPDEGARAGVIAEVRRHGLAGQVVLTGLLDGDERLSALAAADVFALPAVGEGFSLAVLEAMACGLPVVLNYESSFPEAAMAGACLPVERTVSAWTTALRDLVVDPARRAAMGQRARDLVRTQYSWPRIAAQMDEVYERVLARHGEGHPFSGAETKRAPQ